MEKKSQLSTTTMSRVVAGFFPLHHREIVMEWWKIIFLWRQNENEKETRDRTILNNLRLESSNAIFDFQNI